MSEDQTKLNGGSRSPYSNSFLDSQSNNPKFDIESNMSLKKKNKKSIEHDNKVYAPL